MITWRFILRKIKCDGFAALSLWPTTASTWNVLGRPYVMSFWCICHHDPIELSVNASNAIIAIPSIIATSEKRRVYCNPFDIEGAIALDATPLFVVGSNAERLRC